MRAGIGHRERHRDHHDEHTQRLRQRDAIDARVEALAEDRHLHSAAGNAGEERGFRVDAGGTAENPAAEHAEKDGDQRRQRTAATNTRLTSRPTIGVK